MYYKVLRNGLVSANVHPLPIYINSGISIKYSLGEWTFPKIKGSKLFVFEDLNLARKYANFCCQKILYECEVKNPKEKGPASSYHIFEILKAIRQKKKYSHLINYKNVPDGTIFCDAVKLIERVRI